MAVGTALAIAGGANLIGGLLGGAARQGGRNSANDALQGAANGFNIATPTVEEQQLSLQNPGLEYLQDARLNAEQQGQSELAGISVDPAYKAAQMAALNKLSQVGNEGMTDVMRAQLSSSQRDVANQEQARQNAILQNMAERGAGGSGLELAARLKSSQGSADRALQNSNAIAAQAQQNMLDALSKSGTLGGSMQQEEFGELAKKGSAQDVINQFNTQNRQSTASKNVDLTNAMKAQQQAAIERQAAISNQQQQYNKELYQKQFENERSLAQGKAGLAPAIASNAAGAGKDKADMFGGIGNAIGTVAGAGDLFKKS